MEITLQLFGAFRAFGEQLTLSLPEGAIISDIRKTLIKKLNELDSSFDKLSLIDSSRFATETEILNEDTTLENGSIITIIPPVAGG